MNEFKPSFKFIKAVYYKKTPEEEREKDWYQNGNGFAIRMHLDETSNLKGVLNVVLGSQNKVFTTKEKLIIIKNSAPYECEVREGGIHLLNNLTLRKWIAKENAYRCEVIELFFK